MSENNGGWIKIYKKIWQNPVVCRDSETFMIWIYLLTEASHPDRDYLFCGERITVHSGQILTTVKKISNELKIDTHKVERTLIYFEKNLQIEKQKSNKNSLINIVNWDTYQNQNEKQVRNKRETTEIQVRNNRETSEKPIYNKNIKNNKNNIDCSDSQEYTPAQAQVCEPTAVDEVEAEQPTVKDVLNYASELGSPVDCYKFHDFYSKRHWTSGGSAINDWRALFRSWTEKTRASPMPAVHSSESFYDSGGSFDEDEFFRAALRRGMDINNF